MSPVRLRSRHGKLNNLDNFNNPWEVSPAFIVNACRIELSAGRFLLGRVAN